LWRPPALLVIVNSFSAGVFLLNVKELFDCLEPELRELCGPAVTYLKSVLEMGAGQ